MRAMFSRWLLALKAAGFSCAAMLASPALAADQACETAVVERSQAGLEWDYRIISNAPGFASGKDMQAGTVLDIPDATSVQLCSGEGKLLVVDGPTRFTLPTLSKPAAAEPIGGGAIIEPVAKRPPATEPKAAAPRRAIATKMAPTGAVPGSGASIPTYPVWPPETPSSRASLDRFIAKRTGMSLYDAGQKLIGSFEDADYLEHSFYSAPGGFVLVTRIEKIGEDGRALEGAERYRLPNQRSDPSMTDYIRDLFLEAPPGFYRYIAIVVSNEPYRTSGASLANSEAIKRLRQGSNDLDRSYRGLPFSAEYKVDALIYEFRKDSKSGKAQMLDPGRLPPNIHLARTRLDAAIRKRFAP